MKKVSVVYHSGFGHTTNQAKAIIHGIDEVENVTANLIGIDKDGEITDADWLALDESDAIIFGSPTYMGMASWQFKKFADATSAYSGDSDHSFWFYSIIRFSRRDELMLSL